MPQRLRCRVHEIVDHGGQVYSLVLAPERPAPRFLPGQFLHLALDEYNPGDFWPDSRPFSIASSPVDRQYLRITYAVKGRFTTRMAAELSPGREVWVKMPYGEFIVSPGRDVCLLAGGTGVTAFTAFLAGLSADYPYHVFLFYGARSPALLIYRSLVEAAALRCSKLHISFLVEQGADGKIFLPGRIDLEMVLASLPDPLASTYYLAGPPEMLKTTAKELFKRNLSREAVHIDAWE